VIAIDGFNPSSQNKILFAVKVEDNSMQPDFNPGDLVVIDGECSPKPGDAVLIYLVAKNQTVLRKYRETDGCLFQLMPSNELWSTVNVHAQQEAMVLGVVSERRSYPPMKF
jgi:SOS-response transcriptional repressor LexA